jgi:hypothetical protein
MSELPRLLRASSNPATRRLLEAGLDDAAPADTAAVVLAGLGLGMASSTAAAATAGSAALAAKSAATEASLLTAVKWLFIGVCAGSVTSGGAWLATNVVTHPSASSTPGRDVSRRDAVSPPRLSAPSEAPVTPEPQASSRREEVLPAPRAGRSAVAPAWVKPSRSEAAQTTAAEAPPTLAAGSEERDSALLRETSLVDGARRALRSRDLVGAQSLLDSYDQAQVIGVLAREALLLRVELSLAQGNLEAARVLATRFEQSYPRDAHIVRLRALLGAAGAQTPR